MKRGYYDLSRDFPLWDFWVWATIARTAGVEAVVFNPFKGFSTTLPRDKAEHMYQNVVKPIAELFGFVVVEGDKAPGDFETLYSHADAIAAQPLNLLEFDLEPGPPTVTLRQCERGSERNSRRADWLEFAEVIGARVIEDAWKKPLSVADRFEIYRKSSVNYFCLNGPVTGCMYSNIPYTLIAGGAGDGLWNWGNTKAHPFERGEQLPWKNNRQEIIWMEDTKENLLELCDTSQ